MWMSLEELLSPIEKNNDDEEDILYFANSLYNIDNIYKISVEHAIGGEVWEIVCYTKDNQKMSLAMFPYSPLTIEGPKAYDKAHHYLKNIHKNLKGVSTNE